MRLQLSSSKPDIEEIGEKMQNNISLLIKMLLFWKI